MIAIDDGPAREKLVQLGTSVGKDNAVVLPGLVSPQEVPTYLQASDFMVFLSHSEGMPQSILEAMEKMINDKEFRITTGHKGHLLAKKKFDAKSNAKKFAKALRSLSEGA